MRTTEVPYDSKPWDRVEGETDAAFLAFCAFRDLGPTRTIRAAYFSVFPKAEKMKGTWFNWSTANKWSERAAAYDLWRQDEAIAVRRDLESTEAARVAENTQAHKDNEINLAEQALAKAAEILAIPLVRNSFTEQRGGKLIIHKPTLLSPSHLFAAAALMRAGSDLGRRGLGITTQDDEGITPDQFRRLFFKTTGEVARELPVGALPAPVVNPAEAPDIHLPNDADPGKPVSEGDAGGNGTNGQTNGNGHANGAPTMAVREINRFKPPRDRP